MEAFANFDGGLIRGKLIIINWLRQISSSDPSFSLPLFARRCNDPSRPRLILKRNGIEPSPAPARKTTWKEFLAQHWELIVAADFFTVEVWTVRGLRRFTVLFFIELSSRRVQIAGI